ncbi:MAG: glucosidase, partial [Verrucomicrobiota bacterium]
KKWKFWGPYLSERQWGTVREDYSATGEAWEYFPHDHARSRAYRWGEDGLGGISDSLGRLCLSFAFWNGHDPILKERLFGLTNAEGNHGEDVKEIYYYLDATPTHSYLKMLYKYPQREFPYGELVARNRNRSRDEAEFELLDTGIFDDDRYFDIFIEYAKAGAEDILILATVHNRGSEAATIHVLPQLFFRNTWSWRKTPPPKPELAVHKNAIAVKHFEMGEYQFYCDGQPELLFCENETNARRFYQSDVAGFFKDAFHDYVIDGNKTAVNPEKTGTKAAAHYPLSIPANGSATVRLRLVQGKIAKPFQDFDSLFQKARSEADEFYDNLQKDFTDDDARRVQRQAFAGMIWGKQVYHYNVFKWLKGDSKQPPPPPEHRHGRNSTWDHVVCNEVISMPDKWEYPWFAAWDLAFHCLPFAMIDSEFAKAQLLLLTREWYMHPNGQLPAYEWAFDDVNPPVHAWAAWRVFQIDRKNNEGKADHAFLEKVFHKLMLNFTWWVNRKDAGGRNIFQGGFLGLDNIGVFDRSKPLPTGGYINQADGTSWMAMYCLNLMRIALELAIKNKAYEDIASKFFEHFLHIADAMNNIGEQGIGLWDEEDEFYYDVLNLPDGQMKPLKIRSLVGLIPLFAVETLEPDLLNQLPEFHARLQILLRKRPDLANLVSHWEQQGSGRRNLLSLLRGHRMKCLLRRALDETEFLSDYGIRSLSRQHGEHPYEFDCNGVRMSVNYQPAESESGVFGGNSNWRGPLWMPVNFLIIESLQKFHHYYGNDFKIECPTGSGKFMTINDVANEITHRLTKLFLKDQNGRRPVFNQYKKMQDDPHFRDYLLFYEYFHGDNGRGVGASHQTGWTGLIAKLLQPRMRGD